MGRGEIALNRREFLVGATATAALVGLGACGPARPGVSPPAGEALPELPKQPVSLTIIDVAGQLQLTKGMIDDYAKANSQYVTQINYERATAPELPAKIKAQQGAGQVNIAMALTGSDGLSSGIEQGIWQQLLPNYEKKFPNLMQNFIQPKAQDLAQGFGILVVYGNFGPTFTYNPRKITTPPKTTDDLLQWAKANASQFMYARPANSGPGRSLLMGLPYLLGDSSPRNPDSWDKTWKFLEELGRAVEYYPSGTTPTMRELGQGSRAMVASTMGWDMNPRVLGTVPKDFKAFVLDKEHLIADTQYVVIPKGLDSNRLAVALDLIAWMLKPEQQAKAFDDAYFYPGPAVRGVSLDKAPKNSQDAVNSVSRPEFDQLIKSLPVEIPLDAPSLVKAFDIWDKRVGAGKLKP